MGYRLYVMDNGWWDKGYGKFHPLTPPNLKVTRAGDKRDIY